MQKFLLICSLLSIVAIAPAWANEKPVKVPGTKVFLIPPAGFEPADQFSGFVRKDLSASLAVSEIHGPYDQVINSFSKGELAAKGMNLTASSVIPMGKGQGSIIEFTQSASGKKFKKVACIFGDQSNTTIVTGAMPDSGSNGTFDSLREAVKGARFDANAKLGSLDEGLPFTIADTKKFKKATRLQNTLLFTTTGKAEPGKDNGPLFVVGQSAGDVLIENRQSFARERLEHTPSLKNITIDKTNPIKQSGLDGEEFLAQGLDAQDGVPTYVFHTMLFDKQGYYIFQGLCPVSERAVYEPEYQKLVKNFQLH